MYNIQAAEYCDDSLSLRIMLDALCSAKVLHYAMSIQWRHGPIELVRFTESQGLRKVWISAFTDAITDGVNLVSCPLPLCRARAAAAAGGGIYGSAEHRPV